MKLYSWMPTHPLSLLVQTVGNFAGVELNEEIVSREDLKKPEYLAKCPTGKIPLLESPEGPIFESAAIARYLARIKPEAGLYGSTVFEAGLVDQWVDFITGTIKPITIPLFLQVVGHKESDPASWATLMKGLRDALALLEKHLEGKDFLVGKALTIADLILVSTVATVYKLILDPNMRKGFPQVNKLVEKVGAYPQYQEANGKLKLCKRSIKPPAPKPKEEKKDEPKPKAAAKDEIHDDDDIKEEKKVSKLISLPASPFNFFDFKTFIVNHENKPEGIKELWKQFDSNGYSLWHMKYNKAEGEGEVLYKTANLVNGFLQRIDNDFRRFAFGVHGVYGEEPHLEIHGCYIWRGTEVPEEMKDHPSFEYYQVTKLDHTKEEDRKTVEEFLTAKEDDIVNGQRYREGKYFK